MKTSNKKSTSIPLIHIFIVMYNTWYNTGGGGGNLRRNASCKVRLKLEEGAWVVWYTISSRPARGCRRRIARRIERESRKWRVIVCWKHNLRISGGWAQARASKGRTVYTRELSKLSLEGTRVLLLPRELPAPLELFEIHQPPSHFDRSLYSAR